MNTVTETYWLIYAAAVVIWPYHVEYYGSHWVNLKLALHFHAFDNDFQLNYTVNKSLCYFDEDKLVFNL